MYGAFNCAYNLPYGACNGALKLSVHYAKRYLEYTGTAMVVPVMHILYGMFCH
jgi:hypothetical protein